MGRGHPPELALLLAAPALAQPAVGLAAGPTVSWLDKADGAASPALVGVGADLGAFTLGAPLDAGLHDVRPIPSKTTTRTVPVTLGYRLGSAR